MTPAERFLKSLFGEKEGDKFHRVACSVLSRNADSHLLAEQMFIENEVDWEALKLMKDAHLKDVGVPMGPRVKILSALKICNPGAA